MSLSMTWYSLFIVAPPHIGHKTPQEVKQVIRKCDPSFSVLKLWTVICAWNVQFRLQIHNLDQPFS